VRFPANKIRTENEPFGCESQDADTDKQEHDADPLVDFRVLVVMVSLLILGFRRRRFGCFNEAERVLLPWRVVQVDSRANITGDDNIYGSVTKRWMMDIRKLTL